MKKEGTWEKDLLALLESHHARLEALERNDTRLGQRVVALETDTPTEKPFSREEVRAMLIDAACYGHDDSVHESFEVIADRVLREAGR